MFADRSREQPLTKLTARKEGQFRGKMADGAHETLREGEVIRCPKRGGGHSQLELLNLVEADGILSKTYRCKDKDSGREVSRVWSVIKAPASQVT